MIAEGGLGPDGARSEGSPLHWSVHALLAAYAAGTLSPVEVTAEALRRIEAYDPQLGAYVTVTPELALEQARAAEAAHRRGERAALLGVPVSIKDLFDVEGVRTTLGSQAHDERPAAEDSPAVARLRAAGAVFLGKTNTAEFGQSATTETVIAPPARNPWDPARTAGGSSGGAAASVGAGLAAVALGSDGGGSIRIPAAFCGLVGLKPGPGVVPAGGRFRAMTPFAAAGPIARSAADARVLLGVLAGAGPARREERAALKIAVAPTLEDRPVDPGVAAVVEAAANTLLGLGPHRRVAATPPVAGWQDIFRVLVLQEEWRERGELLGRKDLELTGYELSTLRAAQAVTPAETARAEAGLRGFRQRLAAYFQEVDVLLLPATAVTAFRVGERPREVAGRAVDRLWGAFPFTPQFNVGGVPAATLPAGLSAGLPVGLQLVAGPGGEGLLLDLLQDLEAALGLDPASVTGRWPTPAAGATA